jgi:XTP/dITP diphosphohydrolase
MKICVATNNEHKLEEFRALLDDSFELMTLKEIGCEEDIPENEATIEGNSMAKAQYIWDKYGLNCFADDSGLEVDALNGEPGVYSARYAGESRSHEANMDKLLANLTSETNRKAQFKAVITLILDGKAQQFEGIIRGEIIKEKRGNGGFGYDPIFMPAGFDRTFAEMTMDEKNPISHRGLSVKKLVEFLSQ